MAELSHHERIRPICRADAFVLPWRELISIGATPELVLESDFEVVGGVAFKVSGWQIERGRNGWRVLATDADDLNAVEITCLRVGRGVSIERARTLLRVARLYAMEHALEWVVLRLDGPHWPARAALERWSDRDVTLWLFWIEAFVDVAHESGLYFLWRNPAY